MLLFRDSFTLSRICFSTKWRICSPNTRSLVFKLSRYCGTCVQKMGIISKAGIVQEEGHKSNQRYSTLFKCLITEDFSSGGRPEKVPNPLDQYLLCAWPTGRETISTISVLRKDFHLFIIFDVDVLFLFSSSTSLQGGSKVCQRCWVRERGQPLVYQQVISWNEKYPKSYWSLQK